MTKTTTRGQRWAAGTVAAVYLGLAISWGVGTTTQAQFSGGQTIQGFEVPEFDDQNRMTSRLVGELATILPDGMIDINGMLIEFFDEQRAVEMRVNAEHCLYDREGGNAESESSIRIAREGMVITGRGFKWATKSGQFTIDEEAKVVLAGALESTEEGILP